MAQFLGYSSTCWDGHNPDNRDHSCRKTDTNDSEKSYLLRDIISRFNKKGWLNDESSNKGVDIMLEEALADTSIDGIGRAELMSITEYGRAVHAEMSAILDAGRRGVSVNGATLYTTTFPCHNCAKHIIASGIRNIVYIEPYPKSRAALLHHEDIEIDEAKSTPDSRVQFRAFVGIAPRLYSAVFSMGEIKRKEKNGRVKEWNPKVASLRNKENQMTYIVLEQAKTETFLKDLIKLGLAVDKKKVDKEVT